MGAALYYHFCEEGNTERHPLKSAFLGPEYSDDEIEVAIKQYNLEYKKSDNVCAETVKLLSKNNIIGWFQGRSEAGPRALGNRGIIANPALKEVKEILNLRVKFRESFRPFASSILEDSVKDWFTYNHSTPYMLFVFDVKTDKRNIIPGVTHIDGSGRLQTVDKDRNPKLL